MIIKRNDNPGFKKISKWGRNVYVKVPVTNSKGKFMGKVIKKLNKDKIKLNITAVYNAKQTKQILKKIDNKTKVIISIFAGRMGDVGKDPIPEFKKSLKLAKNFKNVEILWASTRSLTISTSQTIKLSYYYCSSFGY